MKIFLFYFPLRSHLPCLTKIQIRTTVINNNLLRKHAVGTFKIISLSSYQNILGKDDLIFKNKFKVWYSILREDIDRIIQIWPRLYKVLQINFSCSHINAITWPIMVTVDVNHISQNWTWMLWCNVCFHLILNRTWHQLQLLWFMTPLVLAYWHISL